MHYILKKQCIFLFIGRILPFFRPISLLFAIHYALSILLNCDKHIHKNTHITTHKIAIYQRFAW